MALSSLRLRRSLSTFSTLHRSLAATPTISAPSPSSSPLLHATASVQSPTQSRVLLFQSRMFRSSSISLLSSGKAYNSNNKDEIGPDTILFEGCDYNHWLFVMDFPKDPKPSPEEMVRTYEETCAKGLNISVEEAKKKMYACSTTTYTGFQAVMTEEESEKFNGLPGVIFVLPDSYIDPQNKEYGGDKYIDGTIIPRPPPVQYGRQTGRYGDRNRFPNQQRFDRQGPRPNQQGNPSYGNQQGNPSYGNQQGNPSYGNQQGNPSYGNQQGNPSYGGQRPTQGGGSNYGNPQMNLPQQSYGPPGQGERRDPMPMNAPQGRDPYQSGSGGPMPSYQGNYNQGGPGNFHPQEQRSYVPPAQGGFGGDNRNYGSTQGANYGQEGGGYRGQGPPEAFGQGTPSGYGQSYPGPGQGEGQSFSQGEQRNYPPMGQTGYDQGRYK